MALGVCVSTRIFTHMHTLLYTLTSLTLINKKNKRTNLTNHSTIPLCDIFYLPIHTKRYRVARVGLVPVHLITGQSGLLQAHQTKQTAPS